MCHDDICFTFSSPALAFSSNVKLKCLLFVLHNPWQISWAISQWSPILLQLNHDFGVFWTLASIGHLVYEILWNKVLSLFYRHHKRKKVVGNISECPYVSCQYTTLHKNNCIIQWNETTDHPVTKFRYPHRLISIDFMRINGSIFQIEWLIIQ